jgi:hypothetical protein
VTGVPVAVLVSTHDHFDDARINMEIVRVAWPQEFANVALVHAYNGKPGGWTPSLEDLLVEVAPGQSHFTGAADLLDAGLAAIARDFPEVQHVVCVASDSWLYRPERVRTIIEDMRRNDLRVAAASWEVADDAHGVHRERGNPALLPGTGLSTDAFVIDLPWALEFGMLPLDMTGFLATTGAILNYLQEIVLLEVHRRSVPGCRAHPVAADALVQGWLRERRFTAGPGDAAADSRTAHRPGRHYSAVAQGALAWARAHHDRGSGC